MKKLLFLLSYIEKTVEWFGFISIIVMLIVSLIEVFFRDVLNSPLTWSLDITLLTMIWMAMLGAGTGVRSNLHIRVAFFADSLTPKVKKIVNIIVFSIIFYFGYYMIVGSYSMAILPGIIPDLGISNAWLYIPVMIGGIFSMLFSAERILEILLKNKPRREK